MNQTLATAALTVQGVYRGYGGAHIIRGVSLELQRGEKLALLGANGSGKTTLLRLMAGLLKPERGHIRLSDTDQARSPQQFRRLVGFLAHEPMLYQDLSCMENLLFFAKLYGLREPEERADEALRQVGLSDAGRRLTRTLSHGMRKRLSMARATLHDPPFLLMDEPEGGLDTASLPLLDRLALASDGRRRTVVASTHRIEWAMTWADRLAVLRNGQIALALDADEKNREAVIAALEGSEAAPQ